MLATFGQVWFLCVLAFLAGSAVTWLLFVRPHRRRTAHPLFRPAPPRILHAAAGPLRRTRRPEPPEPPAPSEPALANLDTHGREPTTRRPGSSAAGALDRLGVAGGAEPSPPIEIPTQGGPVDEPGSGESR
ncbi:MAG TPA: hypothetical protein VKZ81_13200 [Pseudonocardia sp.]|uniref:hypothetical protein n=1 Tax=Pseudonocardia sp. TaxID=60912 RepID=UPI002B4AEFCE|nr:hypothetical protein [Pseudonocardia sp.]HLU56412.1 hypothetical protein [Pseudonocardia sp.]